MVIVFIGKTYITEEVNNLVHNCFYVFVTDAVHMRNNDQPIVFKTNTTEHAVDHIELTQYMTGPNKQYVIKCEQNDKMPFRSTNCVYSRTS